MNRALSHSIIATLALLLPAVAAAADGKPAQFQPPEDLATGWYARMETDEGRIIARLLPEQAPQTVAHFAALAEGRLEWLDPASGETHKGHFYDGTMVYKVKAGFQFEAGDPSGTGRGGPMIFVPREGMGPVDFSSSGRLGMTQAAGGRNSAYQFFVTYAAQPRMTGRYNCFGEVVSGLEVVLEITGVKSHSNGRPLEPLVISEIRIFKVGSPPPLPDPLPYTPTRRKLVLKRKGMAE
jgi:peptidyl-prolyl cis-trans isomerase A (cyclophilin A)